MSLDILASKSGMPYASFEGRALMSSYDPKLEAERLIAAKLPPPGSTIIVLGDCLGYLCRELKRLRPESPLIAFIYHEGLLAHGDWANAMVWSPANPLSPLGFLRHKLGDDAPRSLRFIDWPQAARVFPSLAESCLRGLKEYSLFSNGNASSFQVFGRSWLFNPLKNLILGRFWGLTAFTTGMEVAILGSGPSLEGSLSCLAIPLKSSNRPLLIALSSSLKVLNRHEIKPDLIVSSDAGYWARAHLCCLEQRHSLVCAPLGARIPYQVLEQTGILPLSGQNPYEDALLGQLNLAAIPCNPSGTVAGLALDIAQSLKPRRIALIGIDFASVDLQGHARPTALDFYHEQSSSRLCPSYTTIFRGHLSDRRLAGPYRMSTQLLSYAAYFSERARSCKNLLRIGPLIDNCPGLPSLSVEAYQRSLHDCPAPGINLMSQKKGDVPRDQINTIIRQIPNIDFDTAMGRYLTQALSYSSYLKLLRNPPGTREAREAREELARRSEALVRRLSAIPAKNRLGANG